MRSLFRTQHLLVLLAILALCCGLIVYRQTFQTHLLHGTKLDEPRAIQPFQLTGIDNQSFSEQSLKGQWTMLFFGFTQCNSICPTTMSELASMMRQLQRQHIDPLPHVVMISVDPKRDNLTKLKHFVSAFHTNFYAATGDERAIAGITQPLGIAFRQTTDTQIDHSGTLILLNPEGKVSAYFTPPHLAAQLADDYRLLLTQNPMKGS